MELLDSPRTGVYQIAGERIHWNEPIDEGFRLLAINTLQLLESERRRKEGVSIAVLSAHAADGRSRVAASLGRALAELGLPIVLVDADLGGSGLTHLFDLDESLTGASDYPQAEVSSDFSILLSDRQRITAHGAYMRQVQQAITTAVDQGGIVIVDSPACTLSSVAFYLAAEATGVLYVARDGEVNEALHRDIRGQLDIQGARVLGVVLNER